LPRCRRRRVRLTVRDHDRDVERRNYVIGPHGEDHYIRQNKPTMPGWSRGGSIRGLADAKFNRGGFFAEESGASYRRGYGERSLSEGGFGPHTLDPKVPLMAA